jgi:hypothetical protein
LLKQLTNLGFNNGRFCVVSWGNRAGDSQRGPQGEEDGTVWWCSACKSFATLPFWLMTITDSSTPFLPLIWSTLLQGSLDYVAIQSLPRGMSDRARAKFENARYVSPTKTCMFAVEKNEKGATLLCSLPQPWAAGCFGVLGGCCVGFEILVWWAARHHTTASPPPPPPPPLTTHTHTLAHTRTHMQRARPPERAACVKVV